MILPDVALKRRIGELMPDGIKSMAQVQPASIDMHLDRYFMWPSHPWTAIDIDEEPPAYELQETDETVELLPGRFMLASTVERVRIPHDLVGVVNGRSSLGRIGLLVHVTAGYVDPGFYGNITLELANVGNNPIRIRAGRRVAQLVVHQLSEPCAVPYGAERGSKYVGVHAMRVNASRVHKDFRT